MFTFLRHGTKFVRFSGSGFRHVFELERDLVKRGHSSSGIVWTKDQRSG